MRAIEGQIAVITGGGTGVGAAVALGTSQRSPDRSQADLSVTKPAFLVSQRPLLRFIAMQCQNANHSLETTDFMARSEETRTL